MIKKSYYKKISITLCLIFLQTLFPYNLFANNGGYTTVEATSFEPVDATDMVNLLSGDFSYVLPLLNVPSPEGGYPLGLSYHGGIAIDQQSSWVGLGWNINPGAINRSINGYPDDWHNGNVTEYFYDYTEETINTLSIGYGLPIYDVGASMTWGSHRSLNGSVYFSAGNNFASAGISLGTQGASINGGVGIAMAPEGSGLKLGLNFSYGTNGYSIGAGFSNKLSGSDKANVSLGIQYSNMHGESSFSGAFGISREKGFSTQISLSSSGVGFKISNTLKSNQTTLNKSGVGLSLQFNESVSIDDIKVSSSGFKIPIYIPVGAGTINISYSRQKVKYELNKEKVRVIYGMLHAENFRNISERLEARIINDSGFSKEWFIVEEPQDLPTLPPYNNLYYEFRWVENQKKMMDMYEVDMATGEFNYTNLNENNPALPSYDFYNVTAQGMSGNMSPRILENVALNGLEVLIDDDYDYELDYKIPDTNHYSISYTELDADILFYFNNDNSITTQINPITFQPNTTSTNFFDNVSPANTNQTLPRKKSGRYVEAFKNQDIASGLATSKGLIVPTNYIDYSNGNDFEQDGIGAFKITAMDGKTYHYSIPVYNHEMISRRFGTVDKDKPESESYFERRQIKKYATHWLLTAVTGPDYIDLNNNNKVDANDYGYWVDFDYGKWSEAYAWKTPYGKYNSIEVMDIVDPDDMNKKVVKHYSWGRKDLYYLDAIKTRTHTAIFIKDIKDDDIGIEINHLGRRPDKIQYSINIPAQKGLKLNEILLLKNNDLGIIDKSNSFSLTNNPNKQLALNWQEKTNHANQNIENNVIDVGDYSTFEMDTLYSKSLKVINLQSHYDYSLAKNSPNSNAPDSGRLTLNGVTFKGKNAVQVIPCYSFKYHNDYDYDSEEKDDWGFYKNNPENWSLYKISNPMGSEIIIEHESDVFHQTSVLNYGNRFNVTSVERIYNPSYSNQHNKIDVYFDIADRLGIGIGDKVQLNYWDECYEATSVGGDPLEEPLYTWNYAGLATIQSITTDGIARARSDGFAYCSDPDCPTADYILCNTGSSETATVYNPDGKYYSRKGGGLRVKSISVTDGDKTYQADYDYSKTVQYTIGGTTYNEEVSSGIVSYVPHEEDLSRLVPYASELPPPMVMYEFIDVKNVDINGEEFGNSTRYHFQVPSPNFIDDLISIENTWQSTTVNTTANTFVNISNWLITDMMSGVGRILDIEVKNQLGHILSKTINEYYQPNELNQGILQESFQSYKEIDYEEFVNINGDLEDKTTDWVINSTTKKFIPSVLKQSKTISGGHIMISEYGDFDQYTGSSNEVITYSSTGLRIKYQSIPAYHIAQYGNNGNYTMGSKVDNETNKNMLSQIAAEYTFLDENGNWKPVGVGISTWNNNWQYINRDGTASIPTNPEYKVWRKHKSFVWDGELDANGTLLNYNLSNNDGFNWSIPSVGQNIQQPDQWKEISEVNTYDRFSMPVEFSDINNNFSSTKMDVNHEKVISKSNAALSEQFYSGAEDEPISDWYGGQVKAWNRNSDFAHTGIYSERSGVGEKNFQVNVTPKLSGLQKFKLSVWVHKDNYLNARVFDGNSIVEFNGEIVKAGNWVLMNHYLDINGTNLIYVTSNFDPVYFDDFRLHPIESSMVSYVYNDFDELTSILGTNNLGVSYEFDESGRLTSTYVEKVDTSISTGGFKLSQNYEYNYAINECDQSGSGTNTGPDPITAIITGSEVVCGGYYQSGSSIPANKRGVFVSIGNISGGSGDYTLDWKYKYNENNSWSDWLSSGSNSGNSSIILTYDPETSTLCDNNVGLLGFKWKCTVTDSYGNSATFYKEIKPSPNCNPCINGGNNQN